MVILTIYKCQIHSHCLSILYYHVCIWGSGRKLGLEKKTVLNRIQVTVKIFITLQKIYI